MTWQIRVAQRSGEAEQSKAKLQWRSVHYLISHLSLVCVWFLTLCFTQQLHKHATTDSEIGRERRERENGRVLSSDGSVQVGAYAARPDHHPHRVCSPHCLLSRRPRPPPVQRRTSSFLSLFLILNFLFQLWRILCFGLISVPRTRKNPSLTLFVIGIRNWI